jgi:hypothetical protein
MHVEWGRKVGEARDIWSIRQKIAKSNIKNPMKDIHQNTIKYLTYLVLNKRKLDNKQKHVPPP